MTADLLQQISAHGAAVNLSSRAKLRLTGADRVRYLNGQVTNDVRRAKATETLYACVTDVKGRIAGDVYAHSQGDTLLLDAEEGLRETLSMRLERYIVADDVELTDVTEEWQLWHVWGEAGTLACKESIHCGQEPERSGDSQPQAAQRVSEAKQCPHHFLKSTRYGVAGLDLWLPASADAPTFGSAPILSAADLETWRILQKVPLWPHELNAETFPPEAGLESKAMDFAKGCYIGQEVLSRIKTTGKMPRELISFETDPPVNAGDELWLEKMVGKITSVTRHPVTGQTVGLAMVRQGMGQEVLRVGGSGGQLLKPL